MEVLSSRVLLHPGDVERSIEFYRDVVGLSIYREFGRPGHGHGVVFFLGGGFLELSGRDAERAGDKLQLWLQVRDVDAVHEGLVDSGVEIVEAPVDKPWGLREMRCLDPDGVHLVIVQVPDDHPLRRDTRT